MINKGVFMKKILLPLLFILLLSVMSGCNKNQNTSSVSSMEILNTESFKSVLQEHNGKVVLVNFLAHGARLVKQKLLILFKFMKNIKIKASL